MSVGRLIGIARRQHVRGPMETLEIVTVGRDVGVYGDPRGIIPPNKKNGGKRQVTVMAREAWDAANAELGTVIPWQLRRANLFVEGVVLPREPGARILIGPQLVLEMTMECDPCLRMEDVHRGLEQALIPDWRGGVCCRVTVSGEIKIEDQVRIEAP